MSRNRFTPVPTLLLAAAAALCLAACGGGEEASSAEALSAPRAQALAATEPVSTLVADDGSIMPSDPRATPQDPGARTRAGRYVSTRQAEQFEQALGLDVLNVNIECCGHDGVEQALGIAYGLQAAHQLPNSTPVLVRAADLRLGAAVANRLADGGYTHVWLVTR